MKTWEKIFKLIEEKNISQKEFSGMTGIAESTICDWKRKKLNPGVDKLPAICKVLGISADELLETNMVVPDYSIAGDISGIDTLVEGYRKLTPDLQRRLVAYMNMLQQAASYDPQDAPTDNNASENRSTGKNLSKPDISFGSGNNSIGEVGATDKDFQIRKDLARKLRRLSRLSRLKLDESMYTSGLNLHLFRYLDFLGIDKLDFIKDYLAHIQPYMIREIRSQEKFDNAICVLDEYYRISVYIKVDASKGEEIVVSFHENNKQGIARQNLMYRRDSFVYVFADSIGSHIEGTDTYSVNLFIMRGVKTFPLNIAAVRYDNEGFMVRYSDINNALVDISNRYLEDLYTSDLDFSDIGLFTSLQQLSFTSFGNDVFSNISLLIDSLIIQKDSLSRQIADAALCIYCANTELIESDRNELIDTLRTRYQFNSVKAMPQILERVEMHLPIF